MHVSDEQASGTAASSSGAPPTPEIPTTPPQVVASVSMPCHTSTAEAELLAFEEKIFQGSQTPGDVTDSVVAEMQAVVRCLHRVDQIKQSTPTTVTLTGGRAIPERIGKFAIRRKLGRGGYGVVYLAHDPASGREVALKVPTDAALDRVETRERFLREVRGTARLEHPNLVQLLEAGEVDGLPYIAMSYCSGPTLADWLAGLTEPVPIRLAAEIVRDLARAVEHAHRAGVVHRDIKPGNVIWSNQQVPDADIWTAPSGIRHGDSGDRARPRLADFGLAKLVEDSVGLTKTRSRMGTWRYMAPEQAGGNAKLIGPAADIHALGVILYELLTHRPPYVGTNEVDICLLIAKVDPTPPRALRPAIHRDLNRIVMKCLEKRPEDRYDTAGDLADDLTRFLNDEPIAARPMGIWRKVHSAVRRRPMASSTVALSVIALSMVATLNWKFNRDLESASRRADSLEFERARESRAARVFSYSADMRRAYDAWENSQLKNVDELLEKLRPNPGEEDLRGFDWHYLHRVSRGFARTWDSLHQRVLALAFAPTQPLLASAGADGCIRIWSVPEGRLLRELRGHAKTEVDGLAISADGKWLCSGGSDNLAILWNIETGAMHRQLVGHTAWVANVVFTPDSKSVITAGDQRLLQWDVTSGKLVRVFGTYKDQVRGLDIDPQAKWLAVSCEDKDVWLHDFATTKPLHSNPLDAPGNFAGFARYVHFMPNSTSLQASFQNDLFVSWNLGRGRFLQTNAVQGLAARQFAVDLGCRFALSAGNDKAVRVHQCNSSMDTIAKIRLHRNVADALALKRDSTWAATGDRDGAIHLFNPHATQLGASLRIDRRMNPRPSIANALSRLIIVHDENVFATAGMPGPHGVGQCRSIDGASVAAAAKKLSGRPEDQDKAPTVANKIVDIAWVTEAVIAVMLQDRIVFWNLVSERVVRSITIANGRSAQLLRVTGDEAWIARTDSVQHVDLNDGGILFSVPMAHDWSCARLSRDGHRLAVSPRRGDIEVWDVANRRKLHDFRGHSHHIRCVDFSDNGSIVSADEFGEIKLWDVESGEYLGPFVGPDTTIVGVGFLGGDRNVAAYDDKSYLWIWRIDTGALVAKLEMRGYSKAAFFSNVNRIALTAPGKNETLLTELDGAP